MNFPDEFLSPVQMGIGQYIDHGRNFLDEGTPNGVDKFLNLVLAGRLYRDDDECRVLINARQGAIVPTLDDCNITVDFDSLQSIAPNIPLKCPLSIFPVPDFKYTLKKSVHITFPIRTREVSILPYVEIAHETNT